MQRLEVSCAVRLIYTSLGAKGLTTKHITELNLAFIQNTIVIPKRVNSTVLGHTLVSYVAIIYEFVKITDIFAFSRVCKIAKSDYQLRHVRPSTWNNFAPTGRIMKFVYFSKIC